MLGQNMYGRIALKLVNETIRKITDAYKQQSGPTQPNYLNKSETIRTSEEFILMLAGYGVLGQEAYLAVLKSRSAHPELAAYLPSKDSMPETMNLAEKGRQEIAYRPQLTSKPIIELQGASDGNNQRKYQSKYQKKLYNLNQHVTRWYNAVKAFRKLRQESAKEYNPNDDNKDEGTTPVLYEPRFESNNDTGISRASPYKGRSVSYRRRSNSKSNDQEESGLERLVA